MDYGIMIQRLSLTHLAPGHASTYAHWQHSYVAPTPALHDHDFHELFWIEAGEGWHHINGERRPLAVGLLAFVRDTDIHGFSSARPGEVLRLVNFAFPRVLWRAAVRRHPALHDTGFDVADHRRREWRLSPAAIARLHTLGRELAGGARDPLSTEAMLLGVLALVGGEIRRAAAGGVPDWLAEAVAQLQDPRHFSLGTPELARLSGRTPEHLARAVRRHLGCTPSDLVNSARLDHAARQLRASSRPVREIMVDCGLTNLGHFYKLFRTRHGATPEQYRRHACAPGG